ncbi:NPC intracellular cholesterol transporter 2 homolog a [Solenopsis invicta]|uniref:NPC intracellular cholesterol transporter 2 homolog a n=1 Tax=Solenopsis invicta TaxID=13686 RepID=UPI0001FEC030|nr:NPC intracellular cholesterol transporter 2 homolog a [Solenopsis invicta]
MSQVTIVAFSLFCVLCFASCFAFTFTDCGSALGKFTEVSVSGCPTSKEKCILVRGTNESISIKFKPNNDISQVNIRVYGILMNVPVPFPFEKSDACKDPNAGINCPLHKDQEYDYTASLFVQKKYPSVSVTIQWELVNEKKEKIICLQFPAKVK